MPNEIFNGATEDDGNSIFLDNGILEGVKPGELKHLGETDTLAVRKAFEESATSALLNRLQFQKVCSFL